VSPEARQRWRERKEAGIRVRLQRVIDREPCEATDEDLEATASEMLEIFRRGA
jgi:hypothetical protein